MYTTIRKLDELHTVATPIQGTYKDYIGTASINDTYTVKVMLKSGSLDVTNKKVTTYNFTQGYILIKPLIDQFSKENPNTKCKKITDWKRNQVQVGNSRGDFTIEILGSAEVKGTYFHPSIVSEVLAWVSKDLKKMIFDTFENAVIEQNQLNSNINIAQEEEKSSGILKGINNYNAELTADNLDTFQSRNQQYIPFEENIEQESVSTDSPGIKELLQKKFKIEKDRSALNSQFNTLLMNKQYGLLQDIKEHIDALDVNIKRIEEQIKNMNTGSIYAIRDKRTGKVIYFGQSRAKDAVISQTQQQERFKGHWAQLMKVFNGNDLFHVFLAGQLAEFGCIHGIKKDQLRPEHFKELFEVILVESNVQIGAELDELEQLYIQKPAQMTQQPIGTLMNTNFNPVFGADTEDKQTKSRSKSPQIRSKAPVEISASTQVKLVNLANIVEDSNEQNTNDVSIVIDQFKCGNFNKCGRQFVTQKGCNIHQNACNKKQ